MILQKAELPFVSSKKKLNFLWNLLLNQKDSFIKIILGSSSIRRSNLLRNSGIKFDEIIPPKIKENNLLNELPKSYAKRMAFEKARKIFETNKGSYILSADTVVSLEENILPKAKNVKIATNCLNMLSGKTHTVFGGICLYSPNGLYKIKCSTSKVKFCKLNRIEKQHYLKTNEWKDKAGGYAIQGIASSFVKKISGSYTNIVGIDTFIVRNLFKELGLMNES